MLTTASRSGLVRPNFEGPLTEASSPPQTTSIQGLISPNEQSCPGPRLIPQTASVESVEASSPKDTAWPARELQQTKSRGAAGESARPA